MPISGEAGRYDQRVRIESRDESTLNSYGEPVPTWKLFATRWASAMPISGREYWQGQQVESGVTHRVRMRSDTQTRQLTPKHRLVLGTRILEISRVYDVDSRKIEIEMLCQEDV